jgi:hypothetical protein
MAILFGDSPVGQWKLSGLRVDYMDIARSETAVYASDSYGFGISIPLQVIPAGVLFNTTVNGPFTNDILGAAGINLNVNLYPDGTGAIGEGSYYPDVETGTLPDGSSDCITTGKIFPITDQFNWSESDTEVPFAMTNILGLPSANAAAGQTAEGLGVNGSGVFDNWPATPVHIPVPSVLAAVVTNAGTEDQVIIPSAGAACAGGLAEGYFGGDMAACVGEVTADPASFGGAGLLPGQWGGMYSTGSFDSQMGQDLETKFLLEWHAIDGWESESGLGDDLTVDEDGDGTEFDRIFGIPYITSTAINSDNPLCDLTGGALTGAGSGLTYPLAGDIVSELGGPEAVSAFVTGSCIDATAASIDGLCQGAGGPAEFVYGSCLAQVEDGVEAQCVEAGGPDYAVAGLCTDASQGPEFLGACEAYGAEQAVILTCLQLGFSDEQCAEGGVLAANGVAGYCSDLAVSYGMPAGTTCAELGTTDCAVLTNIEFAGFLCSGLAATLVESETCDEWAASFEDSFLNENAVAVLGVTCADYAAQTTGMDVGSMMTEACSGFAAASADAGFATSTGMTCTEYGASYIDMCVEGVVGVNSFYVMDLSLDTWGFFLTFNGASVQQYLGSENPYTGANFTMEEVMTFFPGLFVNDSAYDFDPTCYATGETCGGRLVMDFAPTCVPEVEAHQIVAEFVDLEALDCDANGDVAGGFDDLACSWNPGSALESCDCDDDNGNGALDPEEICFGDGYHDTEFEGPAGDGVVNVVDVVKMVTHIVDPMAQLGGYLFCQGDMNADGFINVVDVVNVVGIIVSPGRVGGATSTTIEYSADEINLTSNGYVGGIDILVEFANESFSFELGDNYAADWTISGNTARIVMIGDENSLEEILTVTEGEIISISNALVANSSNEVTDVTVLFDESQPLSYIIKDAYPNPFNPVTTLSVELNTTADVSVKVFNLTGQLVDVIAQGNFSPNTYNWTWNAENLASGVYFIATQIGNDMNNQKVMLIK